MLNHSWPVVSHELHLSIVVLNPLCLGSDLFLQLAVLLRQALCHNADEVLDFDQNTSEEAQVMSALREANHSTEHVILRYLLARIVQLPYVELLRDCYQSFENADPFGLKAPAEVESKDFWEGHLKKVFVVAVMSHIVWLVFVFSRGCNASAFLNILVGQTMFLLLDELLAKSLKKEAVLADHVFDLLLSLTHRLEPIEALVRYIRTVHLHRDLVIGMLHLGHVDELTKQVLVEREHPRAFMTRAKLDLLVKQVKHLMDEALMAPVARV